MSAKRKSELVSVIVPTVNSDRTIEACLESIKENTHEEIEIIVVDKFSTDRTVEISDKYADKVFSAGPERSAQRNIGIAKAVGDYLLFVDADMVLCRSVIFNCVRVAEKGYEAVIIPEESFGEGFWAKTKKLERSFYVGVSWMEAARFFSRDVISQLGGYNESLTSGEDWDLSQRAETVTRTGRIGSYILHDEGDISLRKLLRKKFYYGKKFRKYLHVQKDERNKSMQTSIWQRYLLFFRKPFKLFRHPLVGVGMLTMKALEFLAFTAGMLASRN